MFFLYCFIAFLALLCCTFYGSKLVKLIKHTSVTKNGFERSEYLDINGQKQFVTISGTKKDNPVIISLHGGPGGSDIAISYVISDNLINEYTFINWDQRGCGRTYYKNIDIDVNNESVNFDQAIDDLDKLVDYARHEFNQDKVIILGHSYGTILGSVYVHLYPQKVKCYIGAAQVINTKKGDIYSYEDALKKAQQLGKNTSKMEEYYANFINDSSLPNMIKLRSTVIPYHMPRVKDKSLMTALTSPFLTGKDLSWSLMQIKDINKYIFLEQKLMDYLMAFNLYDFDMNYQCPVYFISGSDDWTCPVDLIKEYEDKIDAPSKKFRILEGFGHQVNFTSAKDFAREILELLKEN